ncbi:hypothetical protein RNZ50_18785 [Paracoccaceae bacterium Fryx2]|nr:hypothetical protein [Paracoccaceae bacterium Fryx2]
MSDTPSPATHGINTVPEAGWIARNFPRGTGLIFVALLIFVVLVVLAVSTWGIVALAMTALALVPVVIITLVAITFG